MTQILARLTKIEEALDALTKALAKLTEDFAAWVTNHNNKPEPVAMIVPTDQPAAITRKRVRHKPVRQPVESIAHKEPSPDVLSVDTWNGKPSVAVRNGDNVQFLGEGDKAGTYTLKKVDRDGQRAVFSDDTGGTVVKEQHSEE
jgi:hypothetical protein